jgi:hypothetical protein
MARKKRRPPPRFFACPHCGAQVREGAAACRECGSDAETGWSQDADGGASGTAGYGADDDFDYDEFVREEFPGAAAENPRRAWQTALWALIVAMLVAAMLYYAIF